MYIKRHIEESLAKSKKSVLLLGPRQTGKSTLIRQLKPDLAFNLADQAVYTRFLSDPGFLRRAIGTAKTILIDEIQRVPSLLNTVQAIVDEDSQRKFYLTGSSARKLKRGNANLLPGRIHSYSLGPLNPLELGERFDLMRACSRGLLPDPYLEDDPTSWKKTLRTYASTYLREEIQAEALTRNLEGFSRFLNTAAAWSGDFLDYSKMASLAEIDRISAKRFFEILEDTLIVTRLDAYAKSEKVRLVQHPRFYFFDVGVLNAVLGNFNPSADRMGRLFEHVCIQAIKSVAQALDAEYRMSVFRTSNGAEVDLILETESKTYAIEFKASQRVTTTDFKGLAAFKNYVGKKSVECFVVSQDEVEQEFASGVALPLSTLFKKIGWK